MDISDSRSKIRSFIAGIIEAGQPSSERPIADADSLIDLGLIDSFNMIEITSFLETEFDLRIDSEELTTNNFKTVDAIVELVRRHATKM